MNFIGKISTLLLLSCSLQMYGMKTSDAGSSKPAAAPFNMKYYASWVGGIAVGSCILIDGYNVYKNGFQNSYIKNSPKLVWNFTQGIWNWVNERKAACSIAALGFGYLKLENLALIAKIKKDNETTDQILGRIAFALENSHTLKLDKGNGKWIRIINIKTVFPTDSIPTKATADMQLDQIDTRLAELGLCNSSITIDKEYNDLSQERSRLLEQIEAEKAAAQSKTTKALNDIIDGKTK